MSQHSVKPGRVLKYLQLCNLPIFLLFYALMGCQPHNPINLLQVDSIQPNKIEPGSLFQIFGSGFPVSRPCEVRFVGYARGSGNDVEKQTFSFNGLSVSDQEVRVRFSSDELEQFGGATQFIGHITLSFASNFDKASVTGRSPKTQLDILNSTNTGLLAKQARAERALELTDFLGLKWGKTKGKPSGLLIDQVQPKSRAELAGLLKGDVVQQFNGSTIGSIDDAIPKQGASGINLTIIRHNYPKSLQVWIPLDGFYQSQLGTTSWRFVLLVTFVSLCLFFFSPISRVLCKPFVRNQLSRRTTNPISPILIHHPWSWVILRPSTRKKGNISRHPKFESMLSLCLSPLISSAILLGMVFSEDVWNIRIDPLVGYLFPSVLYISYLLFFSTKNTLPERLNQAIAWGWTLALIGMPILGVWFVSGTRYLHSIVASQGSWPWQWYFFRHPALLLGFPLFLAGCVRGAYLLVELLGKGRMTSWILVVYCSLSSGIGAALYLGGWQISHLSLHEVVDPVALGTVLFVAKSWALGLLVSVACKVRFGAGIANTTMGWLLIGTVIVSFFWRYFQPSHQIMLAIGYTSFITFSAAGLITLFRAFLFQPRKRMSSPHPDPFI